MSSHEDLAEQCVRLYNAGDVEGLVDLYTEDATLVTPFGTFEGRAAIHESFSRDKAAFPDRTMAVDVYVEQGDTLADEWTWVGMHTGPLVMPDGTELPPTGKRVEFKGMELLRFRDGKIVVDHMYWDNMAAVVQLGVLPGAAT